MLKLKNITKCYKTGDFVQHALKDVSVSFRRNEFVAILGQSGSGKTTMLNIIGGLDRYDNGDLIINNKSTKNFKDKDWDAYRNNCIGFVFQSYNLITHISILANVEMGMTLSGVSASKRKAKAIEVLDKVGLNDHIHKKPNQLSGGQMQRVAIARALANDPDFILADEPTGALDSDTSVQIMNLIQEIAKDKLVIMVTHNPELAKTYANRTIELKDGTIVSDTNPADEEKDNSIFDVRKTSMKYLASLRLSFNNIKTKKARTLLTSFASSIGIIGIALILALSNGFQMEIDAFERDSLSQMPIMISQQSMQLDANALSNTDSDNNPKYPTTKKVLIAEDMRDRMTHRNTITQEYIDYINKMDKSLVAGISFQNSAAMNIIAPVESGGYQLIDFSNRMNQWQILPTEPNIKSGFGVVKDMYDTLAGQINQNEPGLVLQVDARNQISTGLLEQLGYTDKEIESLTFDEIMKREYRVVLNDQLYEDFQSFFRMNNNLKKLYKSDQSITLKVQAIIRGKEDKELLTDNSGMMYTSAVTDAIIKRNNDSAIVKAQRKSSFNVLTGQPFDTREGSANTLDATLAYLGADSTPVAIQIYPKNFEAKDKILTYLDAFNKGLSDADAIHYTDMAEIISSLSGNIMSAITIVLIAFSAISLIVSSIMIGIITYISVLERTKEIGILRALGARKKDISRVFNAETFIIGVCSGLLGIGIAQLLTIPANAVIEDMAGLTNVAKLNPIHALILIAVSLILTLLGGLIPSKMAARKDPVDALRSE